VNLRDWPDTKKSGILNKYFESFLEKQYWLTIFNAVFQGKIDTWDYQWLYTIWKNDGICINPGVNLVENIGFGESATHTFFSKIDTESQKMNFPLIQTKNKKVRRDLDLYTSNNNFKHDPLTLLYLKLKYREL
jgi:hypothetical protein